MSRVAVDEWTRMLAVKLTGQVIAPNGGAVV